MLNNIILVKRKRGHKIVTGMSGVGKTTLVRTLDSDRTLFMDLEAVMCHRGMVI